jgi:hypothetical protein
VLGPDLVVANEEENHEPDLAALRSARVAVWVTAIRDLTHALRSLDRMITEACGLARPAWLDAAAAPWDPAGSRGAARDPVPAVTPIWRRPWMVPGAEGHLPRR